MQLEKSARSENRQKQTEPQDDHIEIRFIPLPPAQQEAYHQAVRFLAKLILEIIEEERAEVNSGLEDPLFKIH